MNTSSEYILKTSREYSLYVCENRSIPKIADGFKDVQRKVAWLIRNKTEKIKTVALGGNLISSNLYVHGDASASSAIGMMAAPYVNNVPLLYGKGNFGTRVAPTEISAPRYTYVSKSSVLEKLILPDLDIVPLKENYDGSAVEPVHFLPLIPMVLLNGISGIAVGWSTEILRRNYKDIVQACLDVLNGKEVKKLIPSYNLYNIGVNHIENNTWEFTGKVDIVDSSTLLVTELPPDLSLSKFKERLNGMEDDGKINYYTDSSTKDIKVLIKMPRGAVAGWTVEKAIDFLKLKQKSTERIVVVDFGNNSIKQYENAEDVVYAFVEWRLGWYKVRYEYKLAEDTASLNYWLAVKACFDKKLPAKLSSLSNKAAVVQEIKTIVAGIQIDSDQIDKIASLPSYRWAKDAYDDVLENIKKYQNNINEYNAILADPQKQLDIYRSELEDLKKLKV
jgi:DNA gyrase/topoisomerase IV subunit A